MMCLQLEENTYVNLVNDVFAGEGEHMSTWSMMCLQVDENTYVNLINDVFAGG